MSRRSLFVRLAGAFLGIAAVAFAAASIERTVESGGTGGSGGEGTGSGSVAPPQQGASDAFELDPPLFLEYLAALVAIFLAIALVWYLVENRRDAVTYIAAVAVVALFFVALFHLAELFAAQPDPVEPPAQPPPENESEPGQPGTGEGTTNPFPIGPAVAVLVGLAVVSLGAVVVTRDRSRSDSDSESGEGKDPDGATEAAALGVAAGRAAERIEGGDADPLDNEVYRAWRDMTGLLEVSRPETTTPGEFATAAVDAGIAREDVEALTELFEAVRYGAVETTATMETRAISVLRRIEDEYAGEADDSDSSDGATGGGRR